MLNNLSSRQKTIFSALCLLIFLSLLALAALFAWRLVDSDGFAAEMEPLGRAFSKILSLKEQSSAYFGLAGGSDPDFSELTEAPAEESVFEWPSLLIEEKKGSTSKASINDKDASGIDVVSAPGPGGAPATGSAVVLKTASASSKEASADKEDVVLQPCDFSESQHSASKAIVNEIAWMGSAQSPNEEWIEIRNLMDRDLVVTGWRLQNQSGTIKAVISDDKILPSSDFILLKRYPAGEFLEGSEFAAYSGALKNTGDYLKLFDADCGLVDEVEELTGWPAGNNESKKTMERDAGGSGWHDSSESGGSPLAVNSLPAAENGKDAEENSENKTLGSSEPEPEDSGEQKDPEENNNSPEEETPEVDNSQSDQSQGSATSSPTTSQPVAGFMILEIQIVGSTGGSSEDLVKIYNPTAQAINISGWRLRKRTQGGTESSVKVFTEEKLVESGGYFVWANSTDGFGDSIGADAVSTQTLAANNSIGLIGPDGEVVDAVAWGEEHLNPYVEGQVYPINPTGGQLLIRRVDQGEPQDTNANHVDFHIL